MALSRLGASVSFVGNVGKDAFGEELTSALLDEGLDLSMLGVAQEKTGTAFINVFKNSDNQIDQLKYDMGSLKSNRHHRVFAEEDE